VYSIVIVLAGEDNFVGFMELFAVNAVSAYVFDWYISFVVTTGLSVLRLHRNSNE